MIKNIITDGKFSVVTVDNNTKSDFGRSSDYYNSLIGRDIYPKDINVDTHFLSAFNHSETEVSAKWLVRLAQTKNKWCPFSKEEIEKFYNVEGYKNFSFNRLIESGWHYGFQTRELRGGGWIVEKDGLLYFTDDFILRCFISTNKTKYEVDFSKYLGDNNMLQDHWRFQIVEADTEEEAKQKILYQHNKDGKYVKFFTSITRLD